jgi:biotin carboxyl carrier protein
MKYEIVIDNKKGNLLVESSRFTYQGEAGEGPETRAITANYSIMPLGRNDFSVLSGSRSFQVSVLPNGEVSVNGQVFNVEIVDPRSFRGRQANGTAGGKRTITAPMPGRVIRVLVEPGQSVDAGQGLIVVEAMKMQNEMKAPQAGTVTQIKTSVGATVTAGDVLLVIE